VKSDGKQKNASTRKAVKSFRKEDGGVEEIEVRERNRSSPSIPVSFHCVLDSKKAANHFLSFLLAIPVIFLFPTFL
jgi:hypothetical protein